MIVDRKCMRCGKVVQVDCPDAGFAAWQAGELIQIAFPKMSADDREILVSGVCGPCFDIMFPEDADDVGSEDDDTDSDG